MLPWNQNLLGGNTVLSSQSYAKWAGLGLKLDRPDGKLREAGESREEDDHMII